MLIKGVETTMVNVKELQNKSIPEMIRILGVLENEELATADLAKLAYALNVSVLAHNFGGEKIAGEKILCAFATNSKGNSCIFYSDELLYDEARIAIVLAFAKYIITGNNNFYVTQSTKFSERENMLADEMLMPESRVKDVICKLIMPSTAVLADIFQVSKKLVNQRLAKIGIKTKIQGYNRPPITKNELMIMALAEMGYFE